MKTFQRALCFIFLLCVTGASSQPWMQAPYMKIRNSSDSEKFFNLYEIQKAFQRYEKDHESDKKSEKEMGPDEDEGKFPGYNQYKRWENYMMPRVYPSGDIRLPSGDGAEFERYRNSSNFRTGDPNGQSLNGNWTPLGPTGSHFFSYWGGAARVNCIRFDPTNSNIMYVCTPGGGLWKSANGGGNWSTNTDNLAELGCMDVAIDPTNTQIMYLAMGDANATSTALTVSSIGVLKSTDGGLTWATTGLTFSLNSGVGVYKLLINPVSPNIIFAATTAGLYRTANSGGSWTFVNAGNYNDVEFKPGNYNVIYAVQGWLNQGKFWRSTTGGVSGSWTNITSGLPASNNICRYEIAVTPADTDYVYLVGAKSNTNDFYGFYRSTDGGTNFTLQANTPNILTGPAGAQAWYNLCIAASSLDKNKVVVGGTNLWRTLDGGVTWVMNGDGSNSSAPYIHPDQHAVEFLPGSDSIYFTGNDGGVWKTSNNGMAWATVNTGLQIAQMYKLGSYANNPYEILTGHQDEGFHLLQNNNWSLFAVITGDGMESIIDYTNDSTMYLSCNQGHLYRTLNHGQNFSHPVTIGGSGVNATANWVTPNVMHPTNNSTLLIGKAQVYRTTDKGLTWSQVGNVTGGSLNVIALAYAPSAPNYIYAAKTNRLFVSTDGNTFTDRTGTLPVTTASITSIAVSATDSQKVWVTFSGYAAGTKVYYSSNAGITWSNYSTGLPNLPANFIVYQKGSNDGLYVGMDVGVYFISNSLASWIPFMTNLPNVDVEELEIHYLNNKIRAATNGRSLWESDLATPVPAFSLNPSSVCEGSAVTFNDQSTGGPTAWSWSFPGGNPSSSTLQNPTVTYSVAGNYSVTLTVSNANGSYTSTTSIIVHALPPVPTITVNGNILTSSASVGNQWYYNSNIINGATNQTYAAPQNGNYTVVVSDQFGCSSSSAPFSFTGTGVTELSGDNNFTVTPNPGNGVFNIQTHETGPLEIFIYDSRGRLVFETKDVRGPIDLSQISSGIYLVKMVAGEKITSRKLMIQ